MTILEVMDGRSLNMDTSSSNNVKIMNLGCEIMNLYSVQPPLI